MKDDRREARAESRGAQATFKQSERVLSSGNKVIRSTGVTAAEVPSSTASTSSAKSVVNTEAISEGWTKPTVHSISHSDNGAQKSPYAISERAHDPSNVPSSMVVGPNSATTSFSSTSSWGRPSSGDTTEDLQEIGAQYNDLDVPHDPAAVAQALRSAGSDGQVGPKRRARYREAKQGRPGRATHDRSIPRRRRSGHCQEPSENSINGTTANGWRVQKPVIHQARPEGRARS